MERQHVIEAYETAWALTRQMLAAAQKSDWDGLVALEQERTRLIETLQAADSGAFRGNPWRDRKRELIRNIMACDEEIKILTNDWMRELREVLNSIEAERKLGNTYGSGL